MSKTILITGAATGLGKGTAIGLAKAGHNVIATVENWPQVTQLKQDAADAGRLVRCGRARGELHTGGRTGPGLKGGGARGSG